MDYQIPQEELNTSRVALGTRQTMRNLIAEILGEMAQEENPDFVIKTLNDRLGMPKVEGDVGYDLPSLEEVIIPAHGFAKVKTDVWVQLPRGFWGLVTARSGSNNSGQIICLPGVIDNGYRGEFLAFVHNVSDEPFTVPAGKAILQMVLFPSITPPIVVVGNLDESVRGSNGFGSTDKQ